MLLRFVAFYLSFTLIPVSALMAGYSNLITTSDGSTVFFRARTGFSGATTYKLHFDQNRPSVTPAGASVDDLSEDGSIVAITSYAPIFCGVGGSTCFLAPPCQAGFSIGGTADAAAAQSAGRRSIVRLNRTGARAWIEQPDSCGSIANRNPPDFQGLYGLPGLSLIRAREGKLANYRPGRRMITSREQVLTFGGASGIQLQLEDASGAHPLRHVYGAEEAVIDAEGRNLVYVDAPVGHLHWVDVSGQVEDNLGQPDVLGSAPAISDDGRLLAFVSPDGGLRIYRRSTRTVSSINLDGEAVSEFVLAGNGQFIFAATSSGRLVRVDVSAGTAQTGLDPFPEIEDSSAATPDVCPLICYPAPDRLLRVDRLSVVVLRGAGLDRPGWQVQIGDRSWPLQPLSSTAAWFQIPDDFAATQQTMKVLNPGHPLQFSARVESVDRVVSCFGALHQNFDSIVTNDNPAQAGEAVHIFMTGLTGIPSITAGVPNPVQPLVPIASPPAFNQDGGFQALFFGLAPGLIGVQQLDIRIQRAAPGASLFDRSVQQIGCTVPATAR
jgi:uncharacterized protein (TIGR03437 family)